MMYLSGTRSIWIIGAISVVVVLVLFFTSDAGVALLEKYLPHAADRIKSGKPFKYMKDPDTQDAGWQPAQSLYAISSAASGLGTRQEL
jgi:cell division protein FtsW (lipid II flippase)